MELDFITEKNKYFKNITVVKFPERSITVHWQEEKKLIKAIKKEFKSLYDSKVRFIDLGSDIYKINPKEKIKIYEY